MSSAAITNLDTLLEMLSSHDTDSVLGQPK